MPDPVTYTAVLPTPEFTVSLVSGLLSAERARRKTRQGRRVLGCYRHAVLVLRWLFDGTRIAQLAVGSAISASTAYRCLHEAIDVLFAAAPSLPGRRPRRRAHPRPPRRHTDPHRPLPRHRTDRRGGPRRGGPAASTTPPAPTPTTSDLTPFCLD